MPARLVAAGRSKPSFIEHTFMSPAARAMPALPAVAFTVTWLGFRGVLAAKPTTT
jgi:hypothetical protein